MRNFATTTMLAVGLGLLLSTSAQAQDAFASYDYGSAATGAGGGDHSSWNPTLTQTNFQGGVQQAPTLNGATFGTIGPKDEDAVVIMGVNTAGTVRVNNLANIEALLNIIANGMEILGIAWGGPTMILGFMHMAAGSQQAMKKVIWGCGGVTGGLAVPGCINWLVASSRDANLFS
ncbi:MAG: hypothetical protein U0105_26990 [Candidatus Obscuribacterales bacterium]